MNNFYLINIIGISWDSPKESQELPRDIYKYEFETDLDSFCNHEEVVKEVLDSVIISYNCKIKDYKEMNIEKQKHYTPEEVAQAQKFDIDLFINDWFEQYNITDDYQCEVLRDEIRLKGWKFFHYEIVDYCKVYPEKYIVVNFDDIIIIED